MNPVIHDGHAPALAHGHGHGGVGGAHGHHGGHHHEFPGGDFEFPGGNAAAATAAAAAAAAAYHSDPSLFHHFSHAAVSASASAYPTSGSNGSAAGGKTPIQTSARFPPISRLFSDRFNGDLAFSQSENGEKDAAKISGRSAASIAAS